MGYLLFSNKKEQTNNTCNNLDKSPENYTEILGSQELGLGEKEKELSTKEKLKGILIMIAQLCEYIKTIEFCILHRRII